MFEACRALNATVHVERHRHRLPPIMHGIDPAAGQVGQGKGVIEFPMKTQPAIGGDRETQERDPPRAVEPEP